MPMVSFDIPENVRKLEVFGCFQRDQWYESGSWYQYRVRMNVK